MKTLNYKIPPILPLPKGGIMPLFSKEGWREIFEVHQITCELISKGNFLFYLGLSVAKGFLKALFFAWYNKTRVDLIKHNQEGFYGKEG